VSCSRGKGRRGGKKITKPAEEEDSAPQRMPESYDHVTIGFNSTVRRLEALAHRRKPFTLPRTTSPDLPKDPGLNLSVVFVCRQTLPNIMTASLPLLVTTSAPQTTRARLVELSSQAEAKVARALNQPRVGVLGIEEGAPGADTLLRFVAENMGAVEVPWLEEASSPTYYPVHIKAVETGSKANSSARPGKRKSPQG